MLFSVARPGGLEITRLGRCAPQRTYRADHAPVRYKRAGRGNGVVVGRSLTVLFVAMTAALASGAPAQADGPVTSAAPGCINDLAYEVCFNDPTGRDDQKRVIFTRLKQMIDYAVAGDEIRVAMFTWSHAGRDVTRALANAARRQVDVQVIVGHLAPTERAILRAAGIPLTDCPVACISKQDHSHVKLFLMRVRGVKHTVLTSSNLTTPQLALYNNSVRSARDDGLYDFYRAYWDRLDARSWQDWTSDVPRGTLTSGGSLALAFPRVGGDAAVDPVVNALASVEECSKGHAKVWIAMALFTGQRPKIQEQLKRLQGRNCNVRLVIGPGVSKRVAGAGLPPSKVHRQMVHHKFMILDAKIAGAIRQVVFTGSHNFTGHALKTNDEIWASYTAPLVTDTFIQSFNNLYRRPEAAR
jgi:hypothetical protein